MSLHSQKFDWQCRSHCHCVVCRLACMRDREARTSSLHIWRGENLHHSNEVCYGSQPGNTISFHYILCFGSYVGTAPPHLSLSLSLTQVWTLNGQLVTCSLSIPISMLCGERTEHEHRQPMTEEGVNKLKYKLLLFQRKMWWVKHFTEETICVFVVLQKLRWRIYKNKYFTQRDRERERLCLGRSEGKRIIEKAGKIIQSC